MRLTIVVPDSVVGIDGEFRQVDLTSLAQNIRAVQWDGFKGHIEYSDGTANATINDISDFSEVVSLWEALTPEPPTPPTLTELKAIKNEEINAARLNANLTTFTYNGKLFACDQLSRGDIDGINGYVGTRGDLPSNWVGGWKSVDNSIYPIPDIAAWNAFYDSMIAQGQANFLKSQNLKMQLESAIDAEQVAAIKW